MSMRAVILILISTVALYGEHSGDISGSLKLAISKDGDYFIDWLLSADSSIEVIDLLLLPEEESLVALQQCWGLILSGGPDLDPLYYGRPEKRDLCFVDTERDRREWILAKAAIENHIPILGVCRGFQLLNVMFGGTLIADIPTETASRIPHRHEKRVVYHAISIEENTLLHSLAPEAVVVVNSSHHQAIDRLAEPFFPSARSNDQLIEAFEWKDKHNQPFLLAVEWHPERMDDLFARKLAEAFVEAARKNKNFHQIEALLNH